MTEHQKRVNRKRLDEAFKEAMTVLRRPVKVSLTDQSGRVYVITDETLDLVFSPHGSESNFLQAPFNMMLTDADGNEANIHIAVEPP